VTVERFPCPVVDFPVSYLGILLAEGKLTCSTLKPILEKAMNALPAWKGRLMHKSRAHPVHSLRDADLLRHKSPPASVAVESPGEGVQGVPLDRNRCGPGR
jgi:hypothetical protein